MDLPQTSNTQVERIQLQREVEKLRDTNTLQKDEIKALKTETRSYQDELTRLNDKIRSLEKHHQDELTRLNGNIQSLRKQALENIYTGEIGEQVRLRYLEQHRLRMGRGIGALGHERIKCGDRAAHRGRPVVDALLCQTGVMTDTEVFKNLYGVTSDQMLHLKDVPEIIQVASFHASLQSEGRVTKDFKAVFDRFCEVASSYASPMDLKAAFSENRTLQQLQGDLQNKYDKIVAANPRGQQRRPPSQQNR